MITIFNFAPATNDLNEEFNKYVDILIVNEVEAEVFTNSVVKTVEDAIKASNIVLSREGFHIGVFLYGFKITNLVFSNMVNFI